MHGNILGQFLKFRGVGHKIRFAMECQQHPNFATLMNVGANFSFSGLAVRLFICLCQSFFSKKYDRIFHITFGFFQGRFTLHDSRTRLGA